MTRPIKRMPTPQGVGANQTASVNLPLGLTYERLMIDASASGVPIAVADWANQIDEIRLMVNGDARITIDAGDLVKLNQSYGITMIAGVLPLFLSRPWMRTIGGEDQSGYGTQGIATFTLEMDLKAGATIDNMDVFAVQSAGKVFGPHLRIQKFTRGQGVTGEAQIADIPRGNYAMYAVHFMTDSIAGVTVEADQRKVLETTARLREANGAISGRSKIAGLTSVDMAAENRILELMTMNLQDFRVNVDFTATGNFTFYTESLQ